MLLKNHSSTSDVTRFTYLTKMIVLFWHYRSLLFGIALLATLLPLVLALSVAAYRWQLLALSMLLFLLLLFIGLAYARTTAQKLVSENKLRQEQLLRRNEEKLLRLVNDGRARQEQLSGQVAVLTERLAQTQRRVEDLTPR